MTSDNSSANTETSPLHFLNRSNGDQLLGWSFRKKELIAYEANGSGIKIVKFRGLNWFGRLLLRLSGALS